MINQIVAVECKLPTCLLCGRTMSVVPQGILAVKKIRQNEEKLKNNRYQICDPAPTKYSSKYMNSIWGMYNRYSVHNLKKNIDGNFAFAQQQEAVTAKQAVEKNSTDLKGSLSKNFLSKPSFLY